MPAPTALPPFLLAAWRQFSQLKQLGAVSGGVLVDVLRDFTLATGFGWSAAEFERFSKIQAKAGSLDNTQSSTLTQFLSQYHKLQASVSLEKFILALRDSDCSESTIKNYRSDIAQFIEFTQPNSISETLTKPKIDDFVRYQREKGLQVSSIRRKLSSLAQFGGWLQKQSWFSVNEKPVQEPKAVEETPKKDETKPGVLKPVQDLQAQIEELSQKLESRTRRMLLPWLSLLMLLLFFGGLAVFGYRQLVSQVIQPLAYPSSPTRPNRVLSFQGRLTDTAQNPVVTSTNMRFRLYDSGPSIVGGTQLWDSGTCSVDPDQDGIFSTGLGDDCGSEIDPEVFSENANVWLQVEVGAETLSPRQPIRTVAYALNSETLQGYPISATGAATVNTVLVMDSAGDVVLGEVSPEIRSGAGTFTLSGQTLLLQTNSGSNGNIILDANGTGGVQSRDYLSAPGATFSATYAGGTALSVSGGSTFVGNAGFTGNIIFDNTYGTIFRNTSGGQAANVILDNGNNFLVSQNHATGSMYLGLPQGSSTGDLYLQTAGTERLTILDNGNVGIGTTTPGNRLDVNGNTGILAQGDLRLYDSDSSNYLALQAPSTVGSNLTYTLPGTATNGYVLQTDGSGTLTWADPTSLAGAATYWNQANGALFAKNSTVDLLVGGQSTASAKFAVLNMNTGTPVASVSANSGNIATYLTGDGTLATTNRQTLTIGNSSSYNTTGNIALNPNGTGSVSIGTNPNPSYKFNVSGATYLNGQTIIEGANVGLKLDGTGGYMYLDQDSSGNLQFRNNSDVLQAQINQAGGAIFNEQGNDSDFRVEGDTDANLLFLDASTDRVGIGTATPGDKLTLFNGDFRIQRDDSTNGEISFYWGGSTAYGGLIASNLSSTTSYANGYGLRLGTTFSSTPTSGTYDQIRVTDNFAPTSGTAVSNALSIAPTINQTGGASGISRGLYINPTLTAAADWRGIEIANNSGYGIYQSGTSATNYFAGNVGIGDTTPTEGELTINHSSGTGIHSTNSSTGIGLHLANSAADGDPRIALDINGGAVWNIGANDGDSDKFMIGNHAGGTLDSDIRLTIDTNGNVGIGTTSPIRPLQIAKSDSTAYSGGIANTAEQVIQNTDTTNNTFSSLAFSSVDSGGSYLQGSRIASVVTNHTDTAETAALTFGTVISGSFDERLRIHTDGNIGISDITPDAKLNILATTEQLRLDYDDSNYASFFTQADGELQLTTTGTDPDITLNPGTSGSLIFADLNCSGNTNGGVLTADASGVVSCGDDDVGTGGTSYWRQANGAISPTNDTNDVLIGSAATTSAKFAFLNVNTGTPVASVSANSGNIATYLTGDGTLATTNRNNLTIGNSSTYNTTGNLLIHPNGTGRVGIGTDTPQQLLDVVGGYIQTRVTGNTATGILFDNSTSPVWSLQAAVGGRLEVYDFTAGANRFTINSAGNVGIGGIVGPTSKLEVNGDLFAPTATFSANYAAGVPLTVKAGPSATGNMTEWQNSSGTVLSVIDEVGRLGIGTSGPTADIDIARSPGAGPRIIFRETSGGTNWQIGANIITGSGDEFAFYDISNTATRLLIDSSGNVGIGDTTPDAGLNIQSTTEQLRLDYDDSNYASFFTQADGELQLTTTGTDPDITLNPGTSGSLIFADLNCSANANGGALTADASGVISCTDDDSGGAGGSSNWRISNGAISPNNDTLDVLFGGISTASAKFRFLNNNAGTPVASVSANSGNIATYITGDGTLATTNRNALTIGNSSTYNTTGNVLINPNGTGSVGIGTDTPEGKLHLYSGSAGSVTPHVNGDEFVIEGSGVTGMSILNPDDQVGVIYFGTPSDNIGAAFQFFGPSAGSAQNLITLGTSTSNGEVEFRYGNGTSGIRLNSSGNVGIGTTSPGAKLDVVGNIFAPTATLSANYAGGTALTLKGGPSGTANILNIQNNSSSNLAFFNSAGDLTLNAQSDLRLADSDSTNYIALQSPAVVGSNLTYTLPGTVTDGYILRTDGSGTLSWVDSTTMGLWRQANGAISPINNTFDLLVGSNATASAKFAVLNVNTGTPVASISANSGNNAVYLTGDGTLAATNRQDITIGNSSTYDTTGDVLLNPNGTGRVGIGTNAPAQHLHLSSSGDTTMRIQTTAGSVLDFIAGGNHNRIVSDDPLRINAQGAYAAYFMSTGVQGTEVTTGTYNLLTTTATSTVPIYTFVGDTNTGIGRAGTDILSLIAGGVNVLNVDVNGRTGLGTTTPGAKLDVIGDIFAPTATFSANYAGGVALTAKGGPSGTANIFNIQNNGGSNLAFFDSAGNLTLNTQNDLRLADSDSSNYLALQAPATVGSDITYTLPGTVTNGYVLQTDGSGTLSWVDAASIAGVNYWRLVNGALSPLNDTNDLLIGGVSTASAKFAFINVNSGSPTASISGNLALTVPTGSNPSATFDVLNGGSLDFRTSPGGNAGLTSRFFIGNNGNVGIGTNTPTSKLQIAGASSTISNSSGDITIDAASGTVSLSGDSLANLLNVDASGQIKPGSFVVNPTALGSGSIIYRSDNGYLHYYNGSDWVALYPGLWQVNLNAFSPVGAYGSVADLLVGGTTTSSAKIAMDATTGYLYAQRFVDKANTQYFLDPAATGHSLSVVGKSGFGTASPDHQIHVNATVAGKALAVFNETGNNSILVASSAGTRVFEIQNEGNIIAGNPTKQDINVTVYGDLFSADDTNLETAASGIVGSYLYDTATDRDGGYWRKSAVSKTLSWYTESRDDSLGIPCNLSSDDRCGTEYFPAKANLVLSGSDLYIFDALSNTLWMKFTFGSGNAVGAAAAEHAPSSVTAIDGRVFVGVRGTSGGIYEFNFKTDTMSFYTTTDRSESAQTISGRNGGSNTYSSNSMTAFALTNRSVNDMDVTYGNSRAQLAAATAAGINLIDLDYKLGYEFKEEGSNSNAGDTISDDGNTSNPATNAFDGIESTVTRSDAADSAMTITYQFASSKVIQRYGMMNDDADLNEAPSSWTFQGSSNGSTWVDLDTRSGYDWFDVGTNGNTQYWEIPNTTSYPYYRLVVSDVFNAVADSVRISEIYLQTKSQKPAVRLYGEDMAKNYTPNVSTAANTTSLSKRRLTDWRRVTTNGDYRTATTDTLPYLSVSLRRATAITQYTVSASSTDNREPTAWRMQGSNDGVTWTTLDTQTAQTFAAAYVSKSYTFSNTTQYKHYRLDITANNAGTITEIGDFQVGTPVITASSSSNDTTADEGNLLYQDNGAAAYHWLANAGANEWVQYDYGAANPKVVNSYALRGYQVAQPTRAITGWSIQGSADCSSWTTLDTQTGQSFATDYTLNDYTFSNSTAYRCYRLLVNTLNGGTLASLKGLYFFGAEDRIIASSDESDAADNASRLTDEGDLGAWSSLANDETGWVEKQFAAGQEATVSGMVVTGAGAVAEAIKDFTVYASNDRTTWTELTNQNRSLIAAAADSRAYKFANNSAYKFYQVDIEAVGNSTTASINELKFLGGYYQKVAFSDNAIVGTNGSTGQVDIYNTVFSDTTHQALNFTGTLTTDADVSLSSISSIHSSVAPQLLFPTLSGSISMTNPYALETDGGQIYVGHANGVDLVKNNPHSDPDGNFAPAQIGGRINTTRTVSNPFGFDHYWPMDEASSAAQLNNLGSSGWNTAGLELNGNAAAPVSTEAGKINRAYSFSNAQYIEAARDASFTDLDSNGEFTVGGWVFQDAAGLTGDQYIMGDYINNGATVNGFALGVRDGALAMFAGNNGAANSVAFQSNYASVPTEEWTFVTLKLENSTLKMYINGELKESDATAAFTDGGIFYIGWIDNNGATNNRWQGRLDELFVKHSAISDTDIKKMYERGLKNNQDFRPQVTNADSVTADNASVVSSTTIGSSTLNLAPNALAGKVVEITGGTGAGQTRLITKNSATTLTVSPAWSSTPDSTSDFEVTPYALPGSVNSPRAIRADGQNVFIGLNDGADGGGVVRLSQKSLAVSDYYHGNAGKTDSTSGAWNTTSGYDDIVGIESTTDNLLIMSRTSIWREKLGESLLEAITRLQQAFSAATLDTHTQDMHGTNVRNSTTQVIRKGWGYLDGGDTSRTVYYGITYDDVPIVVGNLAGIGSTVAQTAPTSLEQCTLGTPSVDAIGVSAIRKDRFSMAEANTNNACFTWMSIGSYSGSTPEGSFGGNYTGGADLAEWYGTDDETLEAAEVVSVDPSGEIKVMRSGKPQDSTAIGIIATQPAITMGDKTGLTPGYNTDPQLAKGAKTAVQVALAGRVPVKVSLENGPIKAGDYLTTGTIPGTAAKAVKAGPTIGKALENFDGKSTVVGIVDTQAALGADLATKLASNSAAIATDSADVDGSVKVTDDDQKLLSSGQGVIMAFVNTSYFDPSYNNPVTADTNTNGSYAIDSAGNVVGLGAYSFDLVDNAKYLNELLADAEAIANQTASGSGTASASAQLGAQRENILQAALARLKALGALSLKELNTAQLRVLGSLFSRQIETDQLKTDLISPLTQADLNFQFGTASESGSLNIRNNDNEVVTSVDAQGNLTALGSINAPTASFSGELTAGSITAESSRLEYLEGRVAELAHIRAQTAEIVNATISGTLFADDIYEFDAKVAAALEQPSLLSKLLPSQPATPSSSLASILAEISTPTFDTASISGSLQRNLTDLNIGENDLVLSAEAAYINQYFQVNGNAFFGQSLEVANTAIIGTDLRVASSLVITGNSIAADMTKLADQTLYFQPSGQGKLNFLAGLLTLNDQGEVKVTGNLDITGKLSVQDSLLTNLLQPNDFNEAVQLKLATQSGTVAGATTDTTRSRFEIVDELGTPVATISSQGTASFANLELNSEDLTASGSGTITSTQTSGKAQLATGSTELTIVSSAIKADSLIYITPTSSTGNQVLYVKSQTADDVTTPELESRFVVGLDTAIQENVQFNWWIIN